MGEIRVSDALTAEKWDVHWNRIREDLVADGALPVEASARADAETEDQFGPRPEETA